MAEISEPGMDQSIPQAPAGGQQGPNGAGQAPDEGHDQAPDVEAIRAELDRLKRHNGQLVQDNAKLKRRNENVEKLSDRLRGWTGLEEEYQLTPEQVRDQMKARQDAEFGDAKAKGDVEKLIANRDQHWSKIVERKDTEIKAREDLSTKLRNTIHEITVDRELKEEIGRLVEPPFVNAVFAMLRDKAKGVEDDDVPYGVRPVMMVGEDEMPIKDFMKQWAEAEPDAQPFLIGNRSQGGGAPPGGRPGANNVPRMRRSQMTAKQISDFLTQYGDARFQQLPR